MTYVNHQHLLVDAPVFDSTEEGDEERYEYGKVSIFAHALVQLDSTGHRFQSRLANGISIEVYAEYDNEEDGPATTTLRLDSDQTKALLAAVREIKDGDL